MHSQAEKRRRIAIAGPAFPYRGGIAHFVEELARSMEDRGNDVSITTFTRQYPDLLFPGESQLSSDSPADHPPAERIIDSMNPLSWRKTARTIVESGADGLVIKYWIPFLAPCFGRICRAVRRRGVATIAVVDNALPHERRPFDRTLSGYLLRSCDRLLVMSDKVGRDVKAIVPEADVLRVEHPIYSNFGDAVDRATARQQIGVAEDEIVLLFFGLVRDYKGLDLLIEAVASLRDRYARLRLVVAGDFYEKPRRYEEIAEAFDVAEAVDLRPGYVPDSMVPAYFCAADLVVLPYKSATQSGVAQIAMHFERPMVVTDCGGLADMVGRGRSGIVVEPGSAAALARGISAFLDDPTSAGRMSNGAREMKSAFSWDALCESIETAVDEIRDGGER